MYYDETPLPDPQLQFEADYLLLRGAISAALTGLVAALKLTLVQKCVYWLFVAYFVAADAVHWFIHLFN